MAEQSAVEYRGDVRASEAVHPSHPRRPSSSPSLAAILLYGSWNRRLASTLRDGGDDDGAVPRWVELLGGALSSAGGGAPPSVGRTAASVRVDADDESRELCAGDEADGGLGAPSELPALLFLSLPAEKSADGTAGYGGGSGRLRVEHVRYNGAAL